MPYLKLSIDHAPATKYRYVEAAATRLFTSKVKQGLLGNVVDTEKHGRTESLNRANGQVRSYYLFKYQIFCAPCQSRSCCHAEPGTTLSII